MIIGIKPITGTDKLVIYLTCPIGKDKIVQTRPTKTNPGDDYRVELLKMHLEPAGMNLAYSELICVDCRIKHNISGYLP